jgi:hypothetical protein
MNTAIGPIHAYRVEANCPAVSVRRSPQKERAVGLPCREAKRTVRRSTYV